MKKGIELPAFGQREASGAARPWETFRKERMLWMDSDLVPGAFYSEYVRFFPGPSPTPE